MSTLRIIHDPPAVGSWNMAVDEMMLETVAATGEPTLRFYQWSEPTLSLGYFQSLADRDAHPASQACPVVRRSTGGGAILHDREITYSIALPLVDRWSQAAIQVYDLFHQSLVQTLATFEINATLCDATLHPLAGEPFLCFQRRAKGDVLVGPHKIAGSAQRRKHGAMLQHGSILWEKSAFAPDLPGLDQFTQRPSISLFIEKWQGLLLQTWGEYNVAGDHQWRPAEVERTRTIEKEQFTASSWNSRR